MFCEAIFGPTRDYQCYCGKYKNKNTSVVCDKCGVEVTKSSVRRERWGYIETGGACCAYLVHAQSSSHLGLLLDISRRNLDRVLYFAQYIVTYVDEDARQKALKRLEDEISLSERELIEKVNGQIAEAKKQRDRKLRELDSQMEAINAEYDEHVSSLFEPVIAEGQRVERELTEKISKTIRKPIVFVLDNFEKVLVEANEEVASKHISRVQKIVKERMENLEKDLRNEKQIKLEELKLQKETIRAEAETVMEGIRNQLEDQEAITKTENAKLRDELYELQPFTFLSEARYRELKSRWGQVFKADMGAEAFHDILHRLDLNALAEDLWQEVRTTRSKQKRKKATSRLKVVEAFRRSSNLPEWMILTVLPVIPPDLRPMVQLDAVDLRRPT